MMQERLSQAPKASSALSSEATSSSTKIDSPLALYDSFGKLTCRICSTRVTESQWTSHLLSREHKEQLELMKTSSLKKKKHGSSIISEPIPVKKLKLSSEDHHISTSRGNESKNWIIPQSTAHSKPSLTPSSTSASERKRHQDVGRTHHEKHDDKHHHQQQQELRDYRPRAVEIMDVEENEAEETTVARGDDLEEEREEEHGRTATWERRNDGGDEGEGSLPPGFFDSSKRGSKGKGRGITDIAVEGENSSIKLRREQEEMKSSSSHPPCRSTRREKEDIRERHGGLEREEVSVRSDLPKGFFDDPEADARARSVPFTDPLDEEWSQFQKLMSSEANRSDVLLQEDLESLQQEKTVEEIEDQMNKWKRVSSLQEKLEAQLRHRLKPSQKETKTMSNRTIDTDNMEEGDEGESDDDLNILLDWRNKGFK